MTLRRNLLRRNLTEGVVRAHRMAGSRAFVGERIIQSVAEAKMAGNDSAELVIGGESRRVAMDLTKVDPKAEPATEIEGDSRSRRLEWKGSRVKDRRRRGVQDPLFTLTRFRGRLIP